jgi:predicted RNA-binding Zn-ribbon protein involved in translation (DUF1610 family)
MGPIMSDVRPFHCPSCGASLTFKEDAVAITCSYCNNSVILPDSLRRIPKRGEPVSGINPVDLGDIYLLIANDQKIHAIKRVRDLTGLGLADSKNWVEALERGENPSFPTIRISTPTANTIQTSATAKVRPGCIIFIILSVIGSILPIVLLLGATAGPLAVFASKVNPVGFAAVDLSLDGGEGLGPGQFDSPRAIAADRDGNMYVADYMTGRIQSFSNEGTFRWVINLGNKAIIQSMDIANGDALFVATGGQLRRFDTGNGRELDPYPNPSTDYYFEDVAIAPDGRIALISRGENLVVLDPDMQILFEVQDAVSSITDDSELSSDVAIDSTGNLYILGSFNDKVLKYSPEGRYINQFGGETTEQANGKFRATGDLAVDMNGRVYVSDIFGIQVFDPDGQFVDRFTVNGVVHGMNFDLQNQLYIASNKPQILRMNLRK